MEKSLLIFDVNETLLDLSALKQDIITALENEQAAALWFSELLYYSLVESVCDSYHDFSEIGKEVFKLVQERFGKSYSDEEIRNILSSIDKLNPYPEVTEALEALSEEYRLMAFSNGKPEVLKNQLKNAGIFQFFDYVLSVEKSRKYKPHPAAYKCALQYAHIKAEDAVMIAAHGWDVTGAAQAGMSTVFIERGKKPYSLISTPTYSIKDLSELKKVL